METGGERWRAKRARRRNKIGDYMADNPPVKESFDVVKWFRGLVDPVTWSKSVMFLIMGGVIIFIFICVKDFFFKPPQKQIISSDVIVKPFGKIEKDGVKVTNNQILVEEKPWEVAVGAGLLRYDNKDGWIGGAVIKRKF
jgi:hypothetical protein